MNQTRQKLYAQLVNFYGEKCYICGRSDLPLDIEHLVPQSDGGTSDIHNLRLICRADNVRKSNKFFREEEFLLYLTELMHKSTNFRNTSLDVPLQDTKLRVDIITQRRAENQWEDLLIEVKAITTFAEHRLLEVIEQLKFYKKHAKNHKIAFAFPGILAEKNNTLLREEGIEIWDIEHISKSFSKEIEVYQHPLFDHLFTVNKNISKHKQLITDLISINAGKNNKDWSKYQKHIEKILDYLFGSVLSSPITERSDHFKINRPDFILRNYAEYGFWAQLRDRYFADYIVLDAKNYSKKVTKKEILQVSNYLKMHGTGLFGIIVSRNGGDTGCYLTCREIWAMNKKLVIVLTDDDIINMLEAKALTDSPEEIIRQKIENFRLSM